MSRKFIRYSALSISMCLLLYVILLYAVLPLMLRYKLLEAVTDSCSECDVRVSWIYFQLLKPEKIVFQDVSFHYGHSSASEVEATMKRVELTISISQTNRAQIIVDGISVLSPVVRLIDGDPIKKKVQLSATEHEHKKNGEMKFAILGVDISDGFFTYVRNTKGTTATLNIGEINGHLGQFGTANELSEALFNVHLRARIEKSGSVELWVATLWRPGPKHIDVTLNVSEQNLGDLTTFFKPNAGVELNGLMLKGQSRISVREEKLQASVNAAYRGLKVKLDPLYDRSKTKAFFMNIGTKLAMNRENLDLPQSDQHRTVQATREPGEGIVGFILRGMKEAAIHVAEVSDANATHNNVLLRDHPRENLRNSEIGQ